MVPFLLLLGAAGAAGVAYLIFGTKPAKELPGSGSNVPRPTDDPTRIPYSLPDGTVIQTHPAVGVAIYQAVATGDPTYMRNTAKQLRELGWPREADELEKIASQVQAGTGPASAATIPVSPELPPQVLAAMLAVVSRQNPAEMKAYAQTLRQAGYTEAAQSLEAAANLVESAQKATVPTSTTVVPSTVPTIAVSTPPILPAPKVTPAALPPAPTVVLPPMVVTPTVASTPRRAAADLLVKHLSVDNPPKRKEDQGIVRNYQAAAGRSVDGKYGRGDAMSLYTPESGNHIPPPPRYWPKNGYVAAKQQYDQWLTQQQAADPARAGEWAEARKNSGRYYPS